MPELAELRLTADYINESAEGLVFHRIEKNPIHKGADIELPFKNGFTLSAKSRGKELMIEIKDRFSKNSMFLLMGMGMSGHFQLTPLTEIPKHAHITFYAHGSLALSFVDVRRFGKWKRSKNWSDNRGPDPTTERSEFVDNILSNIDKKAFQRPLYEALMDQKYFNGIGNYLRAEIIYRLGNVNPFLSAKEQIEKYPEILTMCENMPKLAYKAGGGSLKDWKNPFTDEYNDNFMLCYGNKEMAQCIDKNGRRFWYDPKWDISIHRDDLKDWDYYSGLPATSSYAK